jgi:hypothetical protein
MAVYHGKKGRVYMSTTGTGAAVSVANLTAWSIDQSTDTVETTSFGDTNKTYVQGLADVSGTFAGFFNDTDSTLFSGAASADGVRIYLYVSTDAATKYGTGQPGCRASSTGVSEATAISANFVNGAGRL